MSGEAGFADVGGTEDFAEGCSRAVTVGGRRVVVVRWDGELFAIPQVCPHQLQSFEGGIVRLRTQDNLAPGHVEFDYHGPVLSCPAHGWEFELRTGRCRVDPRLRVRSYPVRLVNERVLIAIHLLTSQ